MHGWCGKVLRVNLSGMKIATEPLDPEVARNYIGARGFGRALGMGVVNADQRLTVLLHLHKHLDLLDGVHVVPVGRGGVTFHGNDALNHAVSPQQQPAALIGHFLEGMGDHHVPESSAH